MLERAGVELREDANGERARIPCDLISKDGRGYVSLQQDANRAIQICAAHFQLYQNVDALCWSDAQGEAMYRSLGERWALLH